MGAYTIDERILIALHGNREADSHELAHVIMTSKGMMQRVARRMYEERLIAIKDGVGNYLSLYKLTELGEQKARVQVARMRLGGKESVQQLDPYCIQPDTVRA